MRSVMGQAWHDHRCVSRAAARRPRGDRGDRRRRRRPLGRAARRRAGAVAARRLPADGEVDRPAVDGLRFSLALRGYRMDEVDDVLDRLVDELDRRGERISELDGPAEPRRED